MLGQAFNKTLDDFINYTILGAVIVVILVCASAILSAPLLIAKWFGVTDIKTWLVIFAVGWILAINLFCKHLMDIIESKNKEDS